MSSPHPLLEYRNPYVNEVVRRGEKRRRPVDSDEDEEPVRHVRRFETSGRSSSPGSSPVRFSVPLSRRPLLSLGPLVMFRGRIRRRRYTKTTADMGRRRHAKVVTFKESMPFPDDESSVSDDDSDSDEASEDDDDEDWEQSDDSFLAAYLAKTIDALKAVAATPKAKSSTVPFPDDESSISDDDSDSDEASDDEDGEQSDDSFFFAYFAKTIDALKAVAATPYDFESEGSDSDWVPSLPKGRRRKLNTVRE